MLYTSESLHGSEPLFFNLTMGFAALRRLWFRFHSEMALEGHSSMQAPQSTHLPASMTAMSSQVMAFWGQTSTHAPHATHSEALTVTILVASVIGPTKAYKKVIKRRLGTIKNRSGEFGVPHPNDHASPNVWHLSSARSGTASR